MKVLFVSRCLSLTPKFPDGGFIGAKRNYNVLQSIVGAKNIDLLELTNTNIFQKIFNILFRQSYGLTIKNAFLYNRLIKENRYDFVFFNSSLYGPLIKYCYKKGITSYVFFHNIEARFYGDLYKYKKSVSSRLFYQYVRELEKQSCKYSTFKIVLNNRDKTELFKEYAVEADLLLPVSIKNVEHISVPLNEDNHRYCLFLGSDFYANQQGMIWFIDNVLPYINIDVKIAGAICNSLATSYKSLEGVSFLGYVDDIKQLYQNAAFIVSPIFLGSGMKTKTVEALAYGKYIIGTEEAFVGIDVDSRIGTICNTSKEFINAINSFDGEPFNPYSYEYFKKNLSEESIKNKFESFIKAH